MQGDTVRSDAVPRSLTSVRTTIPMGGAVMAAPGAIDLEQLERTDAGSTLDVAALRAASAAAASRSEAELEELNFDELGFDEIDVAAVEESTDPDAAPPLFAEEAAPSVDDGGDVGAAPALPANEPAPALPEVAAPALPVNEPASPLPEVATPPLPEAAAAESPKNEHRPENRRGKSRRRSKKRIRAAEKARARATARAAGSGPLAEELPADAIEPGGFFGEPPALPEMGVFDMQMPSPRKRSRQDMQAMLQEFSVMFRMDTKVRRRRSGWVIALGVLAVAGAVAFLVTREAPIDKGDEQSIRAVLANASPPHVDGTVYLYDPAPATLSAAATKTANDQASGATPQVAPKRVQLSLLGLKLAQLVHLRALKRGAATRELPKKP